MRAEAIASWGHDPYACSLGFRFLGGMVCKLVNVCGTHDAFRYDVLPFFPPESLEVETATCNEV